MYALKENLTRYMGAYFLKEGEMTIKVKDTIILAAQMLGIDEEVNAYLAGEDNLAGERGVALLLQCFRTVENEIALDYIPLMAKTDFTTATGMIPYGNLEYSVAGILSVEDGEGNPVKYSIYPEYLELESFRGKVYIIYTYAPLEKTIDEFSDFSFGASKRLIAYGIAAEYSLATGELTAANAWSVKYKEALRAAQRLPKTERIKSRRWV